MAIIICYGDSGTGWNMSPVESPGDDWGGHSYSLTSERNCRPPRCLNGLFRRADHRGRRAAVFIRSVGAVWLFITLVTGRDTGAVAQAFKLLRSTSVTRTLGWTVDFVRVVLTIVVTITTPQFESTAAISAFEFIGFTGRWGTTSKLIAAVRTVLLPVTDVVSGDTLSALTGGLVSATGAREGRSSGGCSGPGSGGSDWDYGWSGITVALITHVSAVGPIVT